MSVQDLRAFLRLPALRGVVGHPAVILAVLAGLVVVAELSDYRTAQTPPPATPAPAQEAAATPPAPPAPAPPAKEWKPKMPEPTAATVAQADSPGAAPQTMPAAKASSAPAPPPAAGAVLIPPPPSVVVEVTPDGRIVQGGPGAPQDVMTEIKRLQEKFDQLQDTLNIVVTEMMSDVQKENVDLRAEIKRLQARDEAGLLATHAIPKPSGELIDQLAQEARDNPEDQTPLPQALTPGPFSFEVFKEWGRDPAAAKQLGGNAPTLKGIVGFVPMGSTREDIEALGRELRAQYNDYDNINIEVFDDPVSAQAFIDKQSLDTEHRVLSVSKYSATGRDAVTYYEGGAPTELAPDATSGDAAPAEADAPTVAEAPLEAPEPAADVQESPAPEPQAEPAPEKQSPKKPSKQVGHKKKK